MTKFATPLGEIAITVLGHASLLIRWEGRNIFVDPYAKVADYSKQPVADLILVTHHHYDHLDKFAISKIAAAGTEFVASSLAAKELDGSTALKIGEECSYEGIQIKAVYAYNVENKADNGLPFHPKGEGNGYILNFGGFRVYIAGDTEPVSYTHLTLPTKRNFSDRHSKGQGRLSLLEPVPLKLKADTG